MNEALFGQFDPNIDHLPRNSKGFLMTFPTTRKRYPHNVFEQVRIAFRKRGPTKGFGTLFGRFDPKVDQFTKEFKGF